MLQFTESFSYHNIFSQFNTTLYLDWLNSLLTLWWRQSLSYWNQSIHLLRKSMDWFLYDNGLRHERVKRCFKNVEAQFILAIFIIYFFRLIEILDVIYSTCEKKFFLDLKLYPHSFISFGFIIFCYWLI